MSRERKKKIDEAERRPGWKRLGAGLVTGAADDDPSGIATYTQGGAKYGFDLLWTTFLTLPLMIGIQLLSARIARVALPVWLYVSVTGVLVYLLLYRLG